MTLPQTQESNMSATAEFFTADQNWQQGSTTYWFRLNGECSGREFTNDVFGICEESCFDPVVLDCDGSPVDYNEHLRSVVAQLCVVNDEVRSKSSGL